jgi:ribosomal protein S6--L-glutamate ligase
MADLLYATDDFVAIEPYYEYARDVRCLLIGNQAWAMERRSRDWRANSNTYKTKMIEPPEELEGWTRSAANELDTPIIALDALQMPNGTWIVLEINETPGLSGWPDATRDHFASLVEQSVAP